MNSIQRVVVAVVALALPWTSSWGQDGRNIATQIAPTGTLRAVINLGNPILARQDSPASEPTGVSADLAHALAKSLNIPLALIPVSSAAQSVEKVTRGDADIGFFAIDPIRGQGIVFTPAYVVIEGSYLVKSNSPLLSNEEVDQTQHKVVVGKGSAYDLFLSRELKNAKLIRVQTSPEVVPFFLSGDYDVAAGVKQQLEKDSKQFTDLRLLPGRFMRIEQAMGQPKTRSASAQAELAQFISEMKSNGFVENSLKRHQIEGAVVAP
jgi:polar amino acid transport system substrate-binding protein